MDLCKRLSSDFDITVLAPHTKGAARRERIEGVEVRRFRYAPNSWETLAYGGGMLAGLRRNPGRMLLIPLFLIAAIASSARCLREERFDLIHAHWLIPQGLIAACGRWLARKRVPIICTSHGADLFALRSPVFVALKRFVLRRCAAVTVVSRTMKDAIGRIDSGCLARLQVAPMGADLTNTFTPRGEAERSKEQLLFVGRLAEKKGLHILIDALPRVLDVYPDVRLRVIGDGPERERLHARARALGLEKAIDWLGARTHEELISEYRRATALVFPSIETAGGDQEGLGLVPVEALGCECPVVASELPAVRDLISDDVTGLFARASDPAHLAERILCLLRNPELGRKLGLNGRLYALARFDWSVVSERYSSLLRSVAGYGGDA